MKETFSAGGLAPWFDHQMISARRILMEQGQELLPCIFARNLAGEVRIVMMKGQGDIQTFIDFVTKQFRATEIGLVASVWMNQNEAVLPSDDPNATEGAIFLWKNSTEARLWQLTYELDSTGKPVNVSDWREEGFHKNFKLRRRE